MANTYDDLFSEIRYHLLELDATTTVTNTNSLSSFGGAGDVFRVIHDKLNEFLRRTRYVQTEATLAEDGAGSYSLNAATLDVVRVEVGGVRVFPVGPFEADRGNPDWTSDSGDVQGYYIDQQEALKLTLVPKRTSQTVKVLYVPAQTDYSGNVATGLAATFPIPYGLRWIVKWGVIADLLGQEGELHDPVRAQAANQKWEAGILILRLMQGLPPEAQ